MSIIETALHRAKGQLEPRAEPRDTKETRARGRDRRAPMPTGSATGTATGPLTAPGEARPRIADRFPEVPYDPRVCRRNRVLIQGGDKRAMSQGAASYRTLRTRLLQQLRTNRWSSMAITSPGASEGKSLTSVNLALSIARERNSDVFLLDLDMRKPSVCSYLGVRPPQDLLRFFTGEVGPAEVLFSIGVENLILGASTVSSDNSSELLANGRFPEMLAYIHGLSADALVLIDLPPVVNTDDALVVAPMIDMLLLVATEGRTRRDALQRTVDVLADFNVGGLILNRSHDAFGKNYYNY